LSSSFGKFVGLHNNTSIFNKLLYKFNSFVPVLPHTIPVFSVKMALASHDFGQSYQHIAFFFLLLVRKKPAFFKKMPVFLGFRWMNG